MKEAMRAFLAPALAAVVLLAAPSLRANMAAPPPPATLSSPTAPKKTPLEVLDEKLRFDCAEQGRDLRCTFVATYRIHNPTAAAIIQPAGFSTARARDLEITIDEQPVPTGLSPDESFAVRSATPERIWSEFRITVAAGATRTLRVRGLIDVVGHRIGVGYEIPASVARHLMFGNEPGERVSTLEYFLLPIRTWSGDPTIEVELTAPSRYALSGPLEKANETTYRWTTRASSAPRSLEVTFIEKRFPVYGGLLFGIGGSTGDAKGLRLRAGGEIALAKAPWLLASVAYENSASERHIIVPAIKAASPHIIIIPSVGVGLGAPIQVAPVTRVGARLELDAHFGPLGFLFTLDGYPATSSASALVQPSFMFQLSL